MIHGQRDPLGHGQLHLAAVEILERLDDDKHVVHADAEEQEWDDGVKVWAEEEAHVEGHAKGARHADCYHSQSHHRQQDSLLHRVEAPEDEGDVEKDEGGADEQNGEVAVDAVVDLIVEALLGVGIDGGALGLPGRPLLPDDDVDEVVFPVLCDGIGGLLAGQRHVVEIDEPNVEQGADSGDAAVGVVSDVGQDPFEKGAEKTKGVLMSSFEQYLVHIRCSAWILPGNTFSEAKFGAFPVAIKYESMIESLSKEFSLGFRE